MYYRNYKGGIFTNVEKIIGKKIQEQRKKAKLTQEELSEMIDISPHYLSALERGIYNIKLETLVKILNCIGCSADEIFCDLVNKASAARANSLSQKLEMLPIEEQRKIFEVVDTMIKNAGIK